MISTDASYRKLSVCFAVNHPSLPRGSEGLLSAIPASDALNAALRTNVGLGLIVNFAKPWNNGGMANVPGSYALLA